MVPFRLVRPNLIPFVILSIPLAAAAVAEPPAALEGFTSPYRDVRVGSAYTTTAIDIRVTEGDRVEQGQVLVQLDDAVARATVEVARKAASARGELEAAQQVLKTKQRRLEQIHDLRDRDHATPQELQTAEEESMKPPHVSKPTRN